MPPILDLLAPYLKLLFITFLPYVELRGSIPVGIGLGMNPSTVFLVCTTANVLIIPPILLLLEIGFDWFFRIGWARRHIYGRVERFRETARRRVGSYGLWGLAGFVAIPLPGTGAYSGCLAAYLLGLEKKRSAAAVAVGVAVAGVLVTAASIGLLRALQTGLGTAIALLALLSVLGWFAYRWEKRSS